MYSKNISSVVRRLNAGSMMISKIRVVLTLQFKRKNFRPISGHLPVSLFLKNS